MTAPAIEAPVGVEPHEPEAVRLTADGYECWCDVLVTEHER